MTTSRTTKVLALSMGKAFTALSAIVSVAVLSRVLSKHDYATYRQTLLAFLFIAPLLTLSLPQALYYFLPGETKRKRGMLIDNIIMLAVMGFLLSIFLLSGGNRLLAWRFHNPDLESTLRIIAPYSIFMLPIGAIGACLVVQNRVKLLTVYNILSRLLIVLAIIATCLIWRNPVAPLISNVVTAFFVFFIAIYLMLSAVPKDVSRPSLSSMKAMVKYSVPLGLASMAGTLTMQIDKIIVSSMCSTEDFAVYANGAMEIPLVGIITGSIAVVIVADMRQMFIRDDSTSALRLFNQAAVKSAMILLPTMVFLFVCAKPFIILIYSEKYINSIIPFRFYLCILPVRIVFFGVALMAMGKTKIVLVRSIITLIINAALSILFVYWMGYLGAIVATIVTLYLWSVMFNIIILSKGFGCRMLHVIPLGQVVKLFFISLCPLPLLIVFYEWTSIQNNILLLMISCVLYWIPLILLLNYFRYFDIKQYYRKYFSKQ